MSTRQKVGPAHPGSLPEILEFICTETLLSCWLGQSAYLLKLIPTSESWIHAKLRTVPGTGKYKFKCTCFNRSPSHTLKNKPKQLSQVLFYNHGYECLTSFSSILWPSNGWSSMPRCSRRLGKTHYSKSPTSLNLTLMASNWSHGCYKPPPHLVSFRPTLDLDSTF